MCTCNGFANVLSRAATVCQVDNRNVTAVQIILGHPVLWVCPSSLRTVGQVCQDYVLHHCGQPAKKKAVQVY